MAKSEMINWRFNFKDKEIHVEDLHKIIKPGYKIFIGSGCSEPILFTDELIKEKEWNLTDVQIFHFLAISNQKFFSEGNPTSFRHNTLSLIGSQQMRYAINQGKSDFIPINSSEIPKLFHGKRYKIDVALIQVSPPDKNGYCSLGISVGINRSAVENAKIVVAHINPQMPRTLGDTFVPFSKINYFVYEDRPLLEYKIGNIDETHERIAKYVARLIENGSTLNLGLGKISYILPKVLADTNKQDLAIYSEVLYETIIPLITNGNINCEKNVYPHCMTCFIIGCKTFYDFVDDNPFIEFHPVSFINNIENIRKNEKLCSVYGAMSVDLFGQATNHLGHKLFSGTGGEADFINGTNLSEQGKSIIALKSTTEAGYSRIVPVLPPGLVELRAIDVHYVVTEWGIASLHGKSIRERVMQMIGIAHPKYRQDLLENAKLNNLVYQDQTIPVTPDGIVVACPDIEYYFETKSKGKVLVTPAKPTDERGLQELYYSLSEKDRIMRFLTPQKEFSHEQTQSHLICDYDTCLVLVGIVGKKEEDQRIIAASAYYLDPNTNTAEFSITIHEDYRKQGLGAFLFEKIIEIAEQRGIQGMFGDVYVNNIGMLQILNNIPYDVVFTSHPDEEDTLHFHFYFKSKKMKE